MDLSGYGYGYGYPYLAYQSIYPYYGTGNPAAATVAARADRRTSNWRTRSIMPAKVKSRSAKASIDKPCKIGGMPWSTILKTARSCSC